MTKTRQFLKNLPTHGTCAKCKEPDTMLLHALCSKCRRSSITQGKRAKK